MAVDMEAMRRDYEAGMTLRALALKYGCGKTTVDKWVKRGKWTRGGQGHGQGGQKDVQPACELGELETPQAYQVVSALVYRLLDRVGEALDNPKPIPARDLRSISSTLLDVRQLLNAVSPVEAEEQRLRLVALQKQTEDAGKQQETVVVQFVDTEEAES